MLPPGAGALSDGGAFKGAESLAMAARRVSEILRSRRRPAAPHSVTASTPRRGAGPRDAWHIITVIRRKAGPYNQPVELTAFL